MVSTDKLYDTSSQANSEAFGARLKVALGTRSNAWLAQEIGSSPAAIGKYIRGSQPTIIPAVKMAAALGVRLSWLLAGEGEMKGPEQPKAKGHHLFDAVEADWVFLPFYRFESAMQVFIPTVTETFPVRRDWVKRALGVERGLWVTEMPTDDMPSVAKKGEAIICRNSMFLEHGRAYLLGLDGNLIVRRYTLEGLRADDGAPGMSASDAQLAGVIPVGEILARFGLSPVRPRV